MSLVLLPSTMTVEGSVSILSSTSETMQKLDAVFSELEKCQFLPLKSSLRTSLECSLASAEVLGLCRLALWPPMI